MSFGEMMALAFPTSIWVVLGVCAVLSAVGFYKFVYFLSVGYGFAVCGSGAAILIMYWGTLTPWTMALCLLFMAYGIRLGASCCGGRSKSPPTARPWMRPPAAASPCPFLSKSPSGCAWP